MARGYIDAKEGDNGFMTNYVATRYYRAPEIMLSFKHYTKASKLKTEKNKIRKGDIDMYLKN